MRLRVPFNILFVTACVITWVNCVSGGEPACTTAIPRTAPHETIGLAGIYSEHTINRGRGQYNIPEPPPCSERLPLQRIEYEFVAMGMAYRIVVYAPDTHSAAVALEEAETRVRELDRAMSDYDTESELSKLCERATPGHPLRVSHELYDILDRSIELSKLTDGAFDVTIGPVIQLWRTARRTKKLPSLERLEQARQRVDWRAIVLDPLLQTVELNRPGVQIDLGGIAAGFACDEVLSILRSHQLPRALVDCSGDVLVGDPPPARDGWSVTIAGLDGQTTDHGVRTVLLSNAAITTSGDARQYVEIDGVRYSHIVDPRSGYGLTRRSSTTVIAPTGWQADAYATAVNVMGQSLGLAWIEQQPMCSARIFEVQGDEAVIKQSSRFPEPLERSPLQVP